MVTARSIDSVPRPQITITSRQMFEYTARFDQAELEHLAGVTLADLDGDLTEFVARVRDAVFALPPDEQLRFWDHLEDDTAPVRYEFTAAAVPAAV